MVAHCHSSRPLMVYKASRYMYKFLCGSTYVSTMVMQYTINNVLVRFIDCSLLCNDYTINILQCTIPEATGLPE